MSAVGPSLSTQLDTLRHNASVLPAPSVNDLDAGSCSTDFMHTCPVIHEWTSSASVYCSVADSGCSVASAGCVLACVDCAVASGVCWLQCGALLKIKTDVVDTDS